ncbi:MAG: TonB-dependent receptor [Chitinivibrionales bacterium]|nr:TonB-dependent receptor [Chitinivibrionales bacterium]
MSLVKSASLALCVPVLSISAFAASSPQELDTITVIGTRAPRSLAQTNRSVTVIDREAIDASGASSVAELIDQAVGVDVRQRGADGVQADISMRGSSFEQVLVLVDGVPMSDPQTGHHQLNIPLTPDAIERIEILSGQASRLYGPKAVAGVINIVTRTPEGAAVRVSADAGQFGLLGARASASFETGRLSHRVSASRAVSDGYHKNTDSDISGVTYLGTGVFPWATVHATAGYTDKDFGAEGFYADPEFVPNQRERTTTVFTSLAGTASVGRVSFRPQLSWRRHLDDFSFGGPPSTYRNQSRTDVLSGALNGGLPWRLGRLAVGLQGGWETLTSDGLGDRSRYRGGLFLEHVFDVGERFSVVPGVTVYYVTGLGWKVWPGLDLGFSITEKLRVFADVDYSFREPTFTELYYSSPANQGDASLGYERSLSYEAGLRYTGSLFTGSLVAYRREGRDVIDWVRAVDTATWTAANVDAIDATGGEATVSLALEGPFAQQPVRIEAGYAFVDKARSSPDLRRDYLSAYPGDSTGVPLVYKYGTNYLRHAAMLAVDHALIIALRFNWRLRYEYRHDAPRGHWLFDGRMYMDLDKLGFYAEATNLFDQRYTEAGTVPAPGRWLRGGLTVKLSRETSRTVERPVLSD